MNLNDTIYIYQPAGEGGISVLRILYNSFKVTEKIFLRINIKIKFVNFGIFNSNNNHFDIYLMRIN